MSALIQYDSCPYEKRRGDTDTQGEYHVMIKKRRNWSYAATSQGIPRIADNSQKLGVRP